jgi:Cu+-exporting ATPase
VAADSLFHHEDRRCPACGKAVDPLRAGEVAILTGGFRYFCDRACKVLYLGSLTRASLYDDGVTAEPPPVRIGVATEPAPADLQGTVAEEDAAVREAMLRATRDSFVPPAPRPSLYPVEADVLPPGALTEPPPPEPTEPMVLPPVRLYDEPLPARTKEVEPVETLAQKPRTDDAVREPAEAEDPADPGDEEPRSRDTEPPSPEEQTLDVPPAALIEDDEAPRVSRAPSAPVTAASLRGARALDPRATPRTSSTPNLLRVVGIAGGLGTVVATRMAPPGLFLDLIAAGIATAIATILGTSSEGRLPGARGFREGMLVLALLAAILAAVQADADVHRAVLVVSAGVLAASLLAGDLLFAARRRRVAAARRAIAIALEVPVRVVRNEQVDTVGTDRVKPGETVILSAGDVCPVDGTVGGGEATVIPWSHVPPPEPVEKGEGDAIVAGARVVSGSLRVTTAWTGNDRAFRKLTTEVGAVEQNAPAVRLAAQILERSSVGVALFVGIGAYLTHAGVAESLGAAAAAGGAIAALAIVRAVADLHAAGHLASLARGIVYKDANAFERAGRADIAVVCAHGTLLLGDPEIVVLESMLEGEGPGRILSLAAGAYSAAGESLAASLLRGARARGERAEDARSAIAHAGLGVSALSASGEKLLVGSRAFLLQEKVSVARADARVSELEAEGRNVLLVALDQRLVGIAALQDGLRPGAQGAIRHLHDARIEPVLLAGDARETCETVARALDLDHIRPEVLPADRAAEVRALGEGGHIVAVIGRPKDDDAALGAADVAIALGAAGSSPGEWTASLASEDVRDAALALALARRVHERSRMAMIAGLVPAGAGLLAIAFALTPLWVAAAAAFVGSILAERVAAAGALAQKTRR